MFLFDPKMVVPEGFEPSRKVSKTSMLPLHQGTFKNKLVRVRRFELLYPKLPATSFSHCSLDYFIIHKTWSNLYSLYTFTSIST